MCMTPEKTAKLFKCWVDNLVQLDQVTLKEVDGIYAADKRHLEMVVMKNRQLFLKFNKRENRIDEFFFSKVGSLIDYPKLKSH